MGFRVGFWWSVEVGLLSRARWSLRVCSMLKMVAQRRAFSAATWSFSLRSMTATPRTRRSLPLSPSPSSRLHHHSSRTATFLRGIHTLLTFTLPVHRDLKPQRTPPNPPPTPRPIPPSLLSNPILPHQQKPVQLDLLLPSLDSARSLQQQRLRGAVRRHRRVPAPRVVGEERVLAAADGGQAGFGVEELVSGGAEGEAGWAVAAEGHFFSQIRSSLFFSGVMAWLLL